MAYLRLSFLSALLGRKINERLHLEKCIKFYTFEFLYENFYKFLVKLSHKTSCANCDEFLKCNGYFFSPKVLIGEGEGVKLAKGLNNETKSLTAIVFDERNLTFLKK